VTGTTLAVIIIPVVAFAALGIWLGMVLYASRNPGGKQHGGRPPFDVTGGTFRGDGRQVTPHRDTPPPEAGDQADAALGRNRRPR
jgi:hypothetical protein